MFFQNLCNYIKSFKYLGSLSRIISWKSTVEATITCQFLWSLGIISCQFPIDVRKDEEVFSMDQFLDYTVHLLSLNECIHAYTVTKLQMYDLADFLKIINIPYTSVSSGI